MKTTKLLFIPAILISLFLIACTSDTDQARHTDSHAAVEEYYTCPMHPSVRSDRPGACPVCGMALVKKTAQQEASEDELAGLQRVSLSPTQRVVANVSTVPVVRERLSTELDLLGVVSVAEPNARQITMRFPGRLEKLHVSYTGQMIRAGDPVAEVYSPEAVSAQQEFLLALQAEEQPVATSTARPVSSMNQAERKLELLGFTRRQLQNLRSTRTVQTVVTMYSPVAGTVMTKNVSEQQYVQTGETLFDVADLSTVWVWMDVYEQDLARIDLGQRVQVALSAFPNDDLEGRVTFIDPVLNPETRTIRVRADLPNVKGRLKPQMFVTGRVIRDVGESLVVPRSAVVFTGKRTLVWVEVENSMFEPRPVTIGVRTRSHYQVLEGVREGELVAATGGYLLDSESNLRMPAGFDPHAGHGATGEAGTTPDETGEVHITVKGEYSPNVIRARAGRPLTLVFHREEDSRCTEEIVFEDFGIRKKLPAYQTTTITLTPAQPGEYTFKCGMAMLHGRPIVEP